MNRITAALKKKRCTFLLPTNLTDTVEAQKISALYPTVSLSTPAETGFLPLKASSFAAANQNAGIIVMIEPEIFDSSFAEFAKVYSSLEKGPLLFFVGKVFNRFGLPSELQFKNIQHLKYRGIDVMDELCTSSNPQPKEKALAPTQTAAKAPRSILVGREEEAEKLASLLKDTQKAIFIHGPSGIGKHWLLEEALGKLDQPLQKIPEIRLGTNGLDTLLSRIAIAGPNKNPLAKALNAKTNRPTPIEIAKQVVSLLNCEDLKDHIFVVSGLESILDSRDNSFYKERALELTLQEIINASIKARFVFISDKKLQLHTEENSPHYIELTGIKEDCWQDVFATWHLSEEHMQLAMKFAHRAQGHPLAMRSLAVSIQNGISEDLLEQSKRGVIDDIDDQHAVQKLLQKMFDKLSNEQKDKLTLVMLLDRPVSADWLQQMLQIDRKGRIDLIAAGLLEKTLSEPKLYYVHPLVQSLRYKYPSFEQMEAVGLKLLEEAKTAYHKDKNPVEELCLIQTANGILSNTRKPRLCKLPSITSIDHIIAPLRKIIFKQKKYDVASKILSGAQNVSPLHPDVLLMQHFLARKMSGSQLPDLDKIHEQAGTPETYHYEASIFVERGQIDRAAKILETGCTVFPNNARLCRRLAGIYLRQSRLDMAQNILEEAIKLQPLMPDNYSFLGEVFTRLGSEHWVQAEEYFAKSKELGGDTPPLLVRNARLLRLKAISSPENAPELYKECTELLNKALEQEKDHLGANITLATVLLDLEGDLEAIEQHLNPFLKFKEHTESFIQKARYLARKKDLQGAHNSLNKAYKLSSDNHYAFYVRGEIFFLDGDLSKALEAFKNALERCPPTGAERNMYMQSIERMKAFIQTESQMEKEEPTETELIEASGMGFRRDPGMVVRRKGEEGEGTEQADPSPEQ